MAIKYAPTPRRPRKKTPSLSQRRAHPALRAKLPASKLTASQRAERGRLQRVAQRDADPLYNPAAGLSGQTLYASAKKVTDAQFEPRIGALNRNLRSATIQGTALAQRSSDYYRQLAAEEAKGVATQKALAGMLNQQTAQVGLSTQQAYDQMGAQEQQRQASDVEARGTGLGGDTSRVPEELAAARGSATNLQQAGAERAAAQGAGWAELAASMAQARQLHGGEMQDQLLNRLANQQGQIRSSISDVEGTRGDAFTKNLLDLRQQQFENAVTSTGLDIKQSDIQAQLAGTQAQATAAKAKTALDTKKFKADQAFKAAQLKSADAKVKADTAYKNAQIDIKRGVDPVTGRPLKNKTSQSASAALTAWKLDYAKKHGYLPSTGAPKPARGGANPKGLSPAQQAAAGKQWSLVQGGLAQVSGEAAHVPVDRGGQITNVARGTRLADGSPDPRAAVSTRPATMQESVAALRRAKTPEWAVQAILSIRHHGYVLPSVQQMIGQAAPNVTIPSQYLRPPRRPRRTGAAGYNKGNLPG